MPMAGDVGVSEDPLLVLASFQVRGVDDDAVLGDKLCDRLLHHCNDVLDQSVLSEPRYAELEVPHANFLG
jgi:hypothetical protein